MENVRVVLSDVGDVRLEADTTVTDAEKPEGEQQQVVTTLVFFAPDEAIAVGQQLIAAGSAARAAL